MIATGTRGVLPRSEAQRLLAQLSHGELLSLANHLIWDICGDINNGQSFINTGLDREMGRVRNRIASRTIHDSLETARKGRRP